MANFRTTWVALLVGLILGSPCPSAAQVVSNQQATLIATCDDDVAIQQTRALVQERLSDWDVTLIPEAGKYRRSCGEPDFEETRSLLARAQEEFYGLKLKAARRTLADLRRRLAGLELGEPPIILREVYLFSGWAETELKNPAGAREFYRTVLRLWPQWRPDANAFPPVVVQSFNGVADAVLQESTGVLDIRTTPSGTAVTLDGSKSCITPCNFPGVIPGEHFLRAQHTGHADAVSRVIVVSGQSVPVDLQLEEDKRDALSAAIEDDDAQGARATLDALGALGIAVLISTPRPGAPADAVLTTTWVNGDRLTAEDHPSAEAAVEFLVNQIPEGPSEGTTPDVPEPTDPVEEPAFTTSPPPPAPEVTDTMTAGSSSIARKWWFWTAIGVVAAGAGVGVWALTRPDDLSVVVRP